MGIASLLGSHAIIGALVAVAAGAAFVVWDHARLGGSARWVAYATTARWVAITLTVVSVVLMGSRFASVVAANGGV